MYRIMAKLPASYTFTGNALQATFGVTCHFMHSNEHSKWRDFLRPLVEAAVTALAVYAAGAQNFKIN